ncbi:hypothetical protein NXF25_018937 [Crotalus adamanteus]|uniref:DNA-directed DNA polymerase n=1 Tax=Crotalus adamanteus TaxID=8729 RepID=A0AAW1B1B6_CROAD
MGEAFDKSKPSTFIVYLDANNLYRWAMSQPLLVGGFQWVTEVELNDWKPFSSQDGVGCWLTYDSEYPKELHDLHNNYPLALENIIPKGSKVQKLIPNLYNKIKYSAHYEALKLYESLGMKITKIYSGIKFKEEPWLKRYIDLNTGLRMKATNEFEKAFFKLMNNSVFGKTMENIENRVDVRLVTSEKQLVKLSAQPNYDRFRIFDENLTKEQPNYDKNLSAVHMTKTKLTYNKPIYLGACILNLSKTLMYDFHYNYIKPKYGDRAKLLFTDTDSLAYEIKTNNFYTDIVDYVCRRALFCKSQVNFCLTMISPTD